MDLWETSPSTHTDQEITVYTDGACSGNPGPCGLGVLVCWGDREEECSEYLGEGTNNIAELTAIYRGLQKIHGEGKHHQRVVLCTDSQYAIGVLSKGWKAKANQGLIAEIKATLKSFKTIRFEYVKGHAGIEGNERVDELARQGVEARRSTGWNKA